MAKNFKHELGIEAKDVITGFSGIVMSRTQHITGCNVYSIALKVLDSGKPAETQWFDEARVEKTGEGVKLDDHDDGAGENRTRNASDYK